MDLISPHEGLASCLGCGNLVIAAATGLTRRATAMWDPSYLDQRKIRGAVGSCTFALWGQTFALIYGDWHECPPGEYAPGLGDQNDETQSDRRAPRR